jgi:hypothetical protein
MVAADRFHEAAMARQSLPLRSLKAILSDNGG